MRNAIAISLALALGGCAGTVALPIGKNAFCQPTLNGKPTAQEVVFTDPGFAVRGADRRSKQWISETQEAGIKVCHWERPAPTPKPVAKKPRARIIKNSAPPLDANANQSMPTPTPRAAPVKKKPTVWQRVRHPIKTYREEHAAPTPQ
jgi:hypothetical protein